MNAATVQDLRNYLLYPVGPDGYAGPHPQPIPIASAVYDPVRRTVTLTPQSRLASERLLPPDGQRRGPPPGAWT